ncbi:MAG: type IV secretory system conjugative DNA transfer family protein, partial [Planctomycetaceae bacterium]|nr:type IV secretory system conjugative DNA transfer family protein [Planctomycetaceae bacterium]
PEDDDPQRRCGKAGHNLVLGYHQTPRASLGFHAECADDPLVGEPVTYDGREHLLTIAPTGAGKGRNCIIPTLLRFNGTTIVVDPKGEHYATTHRYREQLGHRVVRLDPFGITGGPTDALNPLDVFDLVRADVETDAQTMASILSAGLRFQKDPFWDQAAMGLISGVIAYLAGTPGVDKQDRNLGKVCEMLQSDDTVYNLAVLLDTVGSKMPKLAYREISSFLQQAEKETRPSILGTAVNYIKAFGSEQVGRTLRNSTFKLRDVVDSKPLTIYLVIPPDRMDSHKALIRLWVATLLKAVLSRQHQPLQPTLFLLDEVAQLEHFALLEHAVAIGRGFGLCCWMYLQDLAQLQTFYPTAWRTIVNNCAVVQTFGLANHMACDEMATLLSCGPNELAKLRSDEQVLRINRVGEVRCRKLDYLHDPWCQGRYDRNPFGAPCDPNQDLEHE